MKIVINSLSFLPNVGGLENMVADLAYSWQNLGHTITVFTATEGSTIDLPYKVIRNASKKEMTNCVKNADIFFEANISLKTCWIGLYNRKKWFVTHQITYEYRANWKERLKYYLTCLSKNIAASNYIAANVKGKSIVIPNSYNPLFRRITSIPKENDIVFVGRLVSDKGAEDLINALSIVKKRGYTFRCTIIGDGPERKRLEILTAELNLQAEVFFSGVMKGEDLVEEINRYRIMVIPSRWNEPFGIVALEGLACGCRIICSSGGGLQEAAGSTAILFPNNDIFAMATAITKALESGPFMELEQSQITNHLYLHSLGQISKKYIDVFNGKG